MTNLNIHYTPPLTKYQKYRKIYWGKNYFLRHETSLVRVKNEEKASALNWKDLCKLHRETVHQKGSNALFSCKAGYIVDNYFLICVLNGEKAFVPYNERAIDVSHTRD